MPNTPDDWQTTVTLHDPERAAFWRGVLGTATLPVVSLLPGWCQLPGYDEPQLCYQLDLGALTQELREALIDGISQRFELARVLVEEKIDTAGVDIPFDNTSWSTRDFAHLLNLIT